ncbi:MAG: hypothetical protein IPP49_02020 [Saprospiraceae bacterium]|nr:hypothetical protein [Saprospiraceae bacterium]
MAFLAEVVRIGHTFGGNRMYYNPLVVPGMFGQKYLVCRTHIWLTIGYLSIYDLRSSGLLTGILDLKSE